MWFKKIIFKFNHLTSWAGSLGNSPGDSEELKSHKAIIVISHMVAILNLVYFSKEYYEIARFNAALCLLIFAIYLLLDLILLRIHRNFKIFRAAAFIGMYIYIIAYHSVMGGYIGSTGYIFYGIPMLSGVQILYKKNSTKNAWFLTYIFTAIILFLLEPIISEGMVPLSDAFIRLTFLNNFILISGLVVLSINYFVRIILAQKLKSDVLIRNILPESVVNELNIVGKSDPIMVPSATAIFMDFVNFTSFTEEMAPQELVSTLNEHFTHFDQIFRDHKVEKLKTIGDGYMAVGGLPETNNSHPLDVVLAGMKVLLYIENRYKNKDIVWNVRIGIHTGSMIAGIIGKTKFSYDVWGSGVNLCARLEAASRPGFINVSQAFKDLTIDFFEFEPRGLVEIKNSKPIEMYFLTDIKEHLRSEHFVPNSRFYELYDQFTVIKFDEHKIETMNT
ncbi:MAG: adenylate/guanylate cyclase domain-containing protein [Nitrosomonadales bacterium]|nr:MAG: adenylate/guanylate cyclase domain-containing protein [Nitrosomonadales bacterium]